MALGDGLAEGDALGAGADRVRGVLDVGAAEVVGAVGGEHGRADPELAVRAIGGGLGRHAPPVQLAELCLGQPVLLAGRGDEGCVAAGDAGE